MFEFIPEAELSKPVLNRLYSGVIPTGTVQYAYQYFIEHGAESVISPLSNTIHITSDNDYQASTAYYDGDLESTEGKSVKMDFVVPDSDKFTHIIIRLHYSALGQLPTISIVGEVPINDTMSTVSYLDTGALTYGTLSLSEFNIGETELFKAEDIAIKNNRLFAANITKEEFSIGAWDARAVRFKTVSAGATEYTSLSSPIQYYEGDAEAGTPTRVYLQVGQ
jgi:hypothetical protein